MREELHFRYTKEICQECTYDPEEAEDLERCDKREGEKETFWEFPSSLK